MNKKTYKTPSVDICRMEQQVALLAASPLSDIGSSTSDSTVDGSSALGKWNDFSYEYDYEDDYSFWKYDDYSIWK